MTRFEGHRVRRADLHRTLHRPVVSNDVTRARVTGIRLIADDPTQTWEEMWGEEQNDHNTLATVFVLLCAVVIGGGIIALAVHAVWQVLSRVIG